jgi:hypothetical protein
MLATRRSITPILFKMMTAKDRHKANAIAPIVAGSLMYLWLRKLPTVVSVITIESIWKAVMVRLLDAY